MTKPQFAIRHLSFVSALAALAGTAFADQTNLMSYLTGAYGYASQAACAQAVAAGENYHASYPPKFAFDGILVPDATKRFIGNVNAPVGVNAPEAVTVARYTLWRLSTTQSGYGAWRRAPTAWRLEGRNAGTDAWTLLDSRTGVAWGGSDTSYSANVEGNAYMTFEVPEQNQTPFCQIRFVPTASNYTDAYSFGLNELELFISVADEGQLSCSLVISGVTPLDELSFSPVPASVVTNPASRVARYAAGATVSVSATSSIGQAGRHFAGWEDLPDGAVVSGETVTLTLGDDTALSARYATHWVPVREGGVLYVTDNNWKLSTMVGARELLGRPAGEWRYFPENCAAAGSGVLDLSLLNGDLLEAGELPVIHLADQCFSSAAATSATIPADIPSGSEGPFHGCATLSSITYLGDFSSWLTGEYTPSERGLCSACPNLRAVDLPNATIIPRCAFKGCPALAGFALAPSCTNIHPRAFEASWIGALSGGAALVKIGEKAFYSCENLSSVPDLRNVVEIRSDAFNNCSRLAGAIVLPKATAIGEAAFNGCIHLASVEAPLVETLPDAAFNGCKDLRSASFSSALRGIGHGAFQECFALESFSPTVFADGFSRIGVAAFRLCQKLPSAQFVFPRSFPAFDTRVYNGYPDSSLALAGASIGSADLSATQIRDVPCFTFAGAWEWIALPATVTHIGYNAFGPASNIPVSAPLREIRFGGGPPQSVDQCWSGEAGREAWSDWKMVVCVPSGQVDAWRADEAFTDKGAIADAETKPHYAEMSASRRFIGAWRNKWVVTYTPPDVPTVLMVR